MKYHASFLGGIFTRLDGRNPNFRVPEIWKAWILDWSSFRASTAVPPPSLPISKYIVIAQHTFRSIYANHLQSNKGVVQHYNTLEGSLCLCITQCLLTYVDIYSYVTKYFVPLSIGNYQLYLQFILRHYLCILEKNIRIGRWSNKLRNK